jgi:hypothetical protein
MSYLCERREGCVRQCAKILGFLSAKIANDVFVSILTVLTVLLCSHLLLPQMGRSALPSAAYFFEPLFRLRPGGKSIERVLAQVSHQVSTMAGTLWQLKKFYRRQKIKVSSATSLAPKI